MKIKKFNEINESISPEQKARNKGYEVGDLVYNNILKKNIKIVDDKEKVIGDGFCTLGAVGENPSVYTKVEVPKDKSDYIKQKKILFIKENIRELIQEGKITKRELKEIIYDYIENVII